MPSQILQHQVGHPQLPQPQVPVVRANESPGYLVALISRISSCIQAVLNFLTGAWFSSSSEQMPAVPKATTPPPNENPLPRPPAQQPNSPPSLNPSRVEKQEFNSQPLRSEQVSSSNFSPPYSSGGYYQENEYDLEGDYGGYYQGGEYYEDHGGEDTPKTKQQYNVCDRPIRQEAFTEDKESQNNLKTAVDEFIICSGFIRDAEKEFEMLTMLLDTQPRLDGNVLKSVLLTAIEKPPGMNYYDPIKFSTANCCKLVKLFLEKRREEIIESNIGPELLTAAAHCVSCSTRVNDVENNVNILTMLLDAQLKLERKALKSILSSAVINGDMFGCPKLIKLFLEKRRDEVMECDPEGELVQLAADQLINVRGDDFIIEHSPGHHKMLIILLNAGFRLQKKTLKRILSTSIQRLADCRAYTEYRKLISILAKTGKEELKQADSKGCLVRQIVTLIVTTLDYTRQQIMIESLNHLLENGVVVPEFIRVLIRGTSERGKSLEEWAKDRNWTSVLDTLAARSLQPADQRAHY